MNKFILVFGYFVFKPSSSVDINFRVKPGCVEYPDAINIHNCTNQRYQDSICQIDSRSLYICKCNFSDSNLMLIIPECSWFVEYFDDSNTGSIKFYRDAQATKILLYYTTVVQQNKTTSLPVLSILDDNNWKLSLKTLVSYCFYLSYTYSIQRNHEVTEVAVFHVDF